MKRINISVIIPCYNSVKYIAKTIASVKRQEYENFECIIVDDGSNDGSEAIVELETEGDDRFLVVHTRNRGVSAARNLGIVIASGEYILPLDADDRLTHNAVSTFAKMWEENPDASLLVPKIEKYEEVDPLSALGRAYVRKYKSNIIREVQDRRWKGYENLKTECTPTISSCFRKSDWARVGGYRDGTMYEDWEFWLRLLYKNDNVVNIPEVLVEKITHVDSRFYEAYKNNDAEVEIIHRMNPEIFGIQENKNPVLVVIPYLASGAQGDELTLSVTGWRKFFRDPYRIVVVGDYHPIVDSGDDITFIECPQVRPIEGQYTPHIDHVHKFRKVHAEFPDTKGFIYTCDDIYPTADFTLADVLKPKAPAGFNFSVSEWRHMKVDWHSDKLKTAELCQKNGIQIKNWVCHLPVYYEWDKLLAIYDKFDCDHVSYIVENIYFSLEYIRQGVADEKTYHDEVRTSTPNIHPLGSVKWVSNANCGWSEKLESMLRKYYQL